MFVISFEVILLFLRAWGAIVSQGPFYATGRIFSCVNLSVPENPVTNSNFIHPAKETGTKTYRLVN